MTGFAAVQRELPEWSLALELRSVNSRFLDLVFKIPDEWRGLEPAVRERLGGALKRGKLECRLAVHRRSDSGRQLKVDAATVTRLAGAAAELRRLLPELGPLAMADVLRWPGVLADAGADSGLIEATARSMAVEAVEALVASRAREGRRLAAVIETHIDQIDGIVAQLETLMPTLLRQHELKLTERLRTALEDAGQGTPIPAEETLARLRQELTLHGMRIDVAEELSRLKAHLEEMRETLARGGPIGKRLDFLTQELNREANTIGSKAVARESGSAAIELKLQIEQIREQVQNLE